MKKLVLFATFMFLAAGLFADVPVYYEPFTSDISGVTTVNVIGDQVWVWAGCAKMTGYVYLTNYTNEDWLITPAIDLTGYTNTKLDFSEVINYEVDVSGNETIWASTDYTGSGDPNSASWSQLNVLGRSPGNTWNIYDVTQYDLSAYDGESTLYIGFKYLSTVSNAGTWEIDEIVVDATGNPPRIIVNQTSLNGFVYLYGDGPSTEQTFNVYCENLTTDLTLTGPTNYEISETSGSGFGHSITLYQSGGIVDSTTIYVRLKANLGIGTYNNQDITLSSTGANNKTVTCNGLVEGNPQIIIAEIMQNADAVSDTYGEWFEIYNADSSEVDINGWTIEDLGGESHTIDNGGSLNIAAGSFLVLGRNSDPGLNGGYTCDYEYSSIYLGNSDDELILKNVSGYEIDRVEWDGGPDWPDPKGASMVFTGTSSDDNNNYIYWTTADLRESTYTGTTGDLGSPGTKGHQQTLPVELSSFTAIYANDFVTIQWATASETDVHGFNIYRSSEDNFTNAKQVNVDLIPGHGTTTQPNEYSFSDESADACAIYYYWLESVDYGGTTEVYGSIQYDPVDIDGDGQLNTIIHSSLNDVFPNPVRVGQSVTFEFMIGGLEGTMRPVSLNIYDIKGRLVQEVINEDMMVNDYSKNWHVNDLANGVYFYQLKTANYQETKKLIIQ